MKCAVGAGSWDERARQKSPAPAGPTAAQQKQSCAGTGNIGATAELHMTQMRDGGFLTQEKSFVRRTPTQRKYPGDTGGSPPFRLEDVCSALNIGKVSRRLPPILSRACVRSRGNNQQQPAATEGEVSRAVTGSLGVRRGHSQGRYGHAGARSVSRRGF